MGRDSDGSPKRPSARSLIVWGAGLVAYIVAVAGRSSLGVAGLEAAERFEISAATLSTFSVLQLAVYAVAQIPVGLVLDRFGSRSMILAGTVIIALGQSVLALAETVPLALVARVLVGLGDAAVLVSVLRMLPAWFSGPTVPVITQFTGIFGQLGQVISAIPVLAVLRSLGWTPAFAALAGLGVLAAILVYAVVRDTPPGVPRARRTGRGLGLSAVMREPGEWVGFFTHYVMLFPANTFLFLWGVPLMTAGHGVSVQGVSTVLTASTVAAILLGPPLGALVGRFPHRRTRLVLIAGAAYSAIWASVLIPTTPRPMWHFMLLAIAVGISVATCIIGFDFARTSVAPEHLGTATGMVNVGGYGASVVAVLIVGVVLDAVAPDGDYGLADFRIAFAAQVPLLALGVVGLLVARHAAIKKIGHDL